MTSKIVVNNIEADAGISTVAFGSKVSATEFIGPVTGNATGLSGSPTLSGITSVSTTNLTVNGNAYPSAGPLSNRNKIINGDMRIDQRNAGASVTVNTTANVFTLDRWAGYGQLTDGVFTVQQSTSTPPAGFSHFLRTTVTTADASIGATQTYGLRHVIEGNNISDLAFGSASAKQITLSFWVRTSLTGPQTFSGSITNDAISRSYVFSYSISAANTWEYKTITLAGDTSGTWETGTSAGIKMFFSLGAGSSSSGTAGSWGSTAYFGMTGGANLIGTLNATLDITGVQLEVGSVATPFEHRSYGQELALCQRYYYRDTYTVASNVEHILFYGSMYGTTQLEGVYSFPVEMRSAPSLGNSALSTFMLRNGGEAITALNIYGTNTRSGLIYTGNTATGTQKDANALTSITTNGTVTYLEFIAEL